MMVSLSVAGQPATACDGLRGRVVVSSQTVVGRWRQSPPVAGRPAPVSDGRHLLRLVVLLPDLSGREVPPAAGHRDELQQVQLLFVRTRLTVVPPLQLPPR